MLILPKTSCIKTDISNGSMFIKVIQNPPKRLTPLSNGLQEKTPLNSRILTTIWQINITFLLERMHNSQELKDKLPLFHSTLVKELQRKAMISLTPRMFSDLKKENKIYYQKLILLNQLSMKEERSLMKSTIILPK